MILTLLALAALKKWDVRRFDVTVVFLHGNLDKKHPLYAKQVPRFEDPRRPHLICRLRQSLYGLCQAGQRWNETFIAKLKGLGFVQSRADPSLFVRTRAGRIVIIPIHVDDGWFFSVATISVRSSRIRSITSKRSSDDSTWSCQEAGRLTRQRRPKRLSPQSPDEPIANERYRKLLGALLYLAICTQPDILYAVSVCSRFSAAPAQRH